MGWQPGHGLGKTEDGQLEPLLMDIKSDRRGLSARDDKKVNKKEILNINGQYKGLIPELLHNMRGAIHVKFFC